MIYLNLFEQSKDVVAYSELFGMWNGIYELLRSIWVQQMIGDAT